MPIWFLALVVVVAASIVTVPLAVTAAVMRARRARAHAGRPSPQTSWPVIIGFAIALVGAVPAAGLVARSTWLADRLGFAGCDAGETVGRERVEIWRGADVGLVCLRPDGGSTPASRMLYVAGGLVGAGAPLILGALATWTLLLRRRVRRA